MSVGAFVLLGMGPTTTAPLFVLMGFGTSGTTPIPPVTVAPQGAGSRRKKRIRYRIKLDEKEYSFDMLQQALSFVKQAKRIVPEIAPDKAQDIILRGIKVAQAKDENSGLEVIEAPSSTRAIVEDRISELERYYWALVARKVEEIEEDDREVWLLM